MKVHNKNKSTNDAAKSDSQVIATNDATKSDSQVIATNDAPKSDFPIIATQRCTKYSEGFPRIFFWTLLQAVQMAFGYSFSIAVIVAGVLVKGVGEMSTEDDNANVNSSLATPSATTAGAGNGTSIEDINAAASTYDMIFMNSVIFVCFSTLFAISITFSEYVGQLKQARLEMKKVQLTLADTSGKGKEATEIVIREKQKEIESLEVQAASTVPASFSYVLVASAIAMMPLLFSEKILLAVGQSQEVSKAVGEFLPVYAVAVPAIMSRIAMEKVLYSLGMVSIALGISVGTLVVGTTIATCLGFGYGVPKMGAKGIAIGFTIEAYLIAIAYGLCMWKYPRLKPFQLFNWCRLSPWLVLRELCRILRIGWGFFLTLAAEELVSILLSVFAAQINQVAELNLEMLFFYGMFLFAAAFGQENTQEMSLAIGEKNYEAASQIAKHGLATSAIAATVLCLIFGSAIAAYEASVGEVSWVLLFIFTSAMWVNMVRYVMLQQLRSLKDGMRSSLISIGCILLGLTISGVSITLENPDVIWIALGYLLGGASAAIALFVRSMKLRPADFIKLRLSSPVQRDPLEPINEKGACTKCFSFLDGKSGVVQRSNIFQAAPLSPPPPSPYLRAVSTATAFQHSSFSLGDVELSDMGGNVSEGEMEEGKNTVAPVAEDASNGLSFGAGVSM